MAHSLSAQKRVRQNRKRRIINRSRKSNVKAQVKSFLTAVEKGDVTAAQKQFQLTQKKLAQTGSTGTMHKKTASRKISRLAKKLNILKAKQS